MGLSRTISRRFGISGGLEDDAAPDPDRVVAKHS